ncbi:MAG TPA: glycoside hydrolase family 16 protein [Flavobacterium sp.]|uniref:glycoside hydrolase family 16 protein n=1 Tax=Flavobacterium sp. TaxID=239 RepID=UPI002F429873
MKKKIFKENPMNRKGNSVFGFPGLALLVLFTVVTSCSSDEKQTVANFKELVMQDEFDTDGAPNSAIWGYDLGTGADGWGNNELQFYTNRTENVKVENGYLLITAKKESYSGSSYTSARLTTKGLFEQAYGRFEARIRLPYGQGIWPAFWLLGANIDEVGWPKCGEIDIMEYRGQEPTKVLGTVHGPGYFGATSISKSYSLVNDRFDTDFHIFGIEWGPEYINYYVDDVLYNQITPASVNGEWVFDHPFYIIINLAVGGNFVGAPNSGTVFPQTMLVDYVRVYKNN